MITLIIMVTVVLVGLMIGDWQPKLPKRSNGWLNCDSEGCDRGVMVRPIIPYHLR